jgi:hypothetical protein
MTPGERGPPSSISRHPQRAQIELALANQIPLARIAKKYAVGEMSLHRYRQRMPPQLIAALRYRVAESPIDIEALRSSESEGILQHLLAARGRIYSLLDYCHGEDDTKTSERLIGRLHENLRLTAELLGDLNLGDKHVHLHLTSTPEWQRLRHLLVAAISRFPEAAEAVVGVLRQVEQPLEAAKLIEAQPIEPAPEKGGQGDDARDAA